MLKINNKESIAFSEVIQSWLIEKKFFLKKSTLLKYKNIINMHILPAFGKVDIKQITAEMINEFIVEKQKSGRIKGNLSLTDSYVKSIAIILNSCINYAVKMNFCAPLSGKIFKPSVKLSEITILNKKSQRLLEQTLLSNNSITSIAITLSYNTGLRIGEICALKIKNIDFDNKIIHVTNTIQRVEGQKKSMLIIGSPKTRSSLRKIPMNRAVLNVLLPFKNLNKEFYLLSKNLHFLTPRALEYRFHKFLKQNNIQNFNFHVLRHTFATKCIECGVDIKVLSEIMGHSSVCITLDRYVHPTMENKRKQLEKLVKN